MYRYEMKITRREIIASISIVAVMLLIGVLTSGKISEHQMDKNEIYNKAVKIESTDLFQFGMDTNVGNAFIYGDLQAVDTVTYPEIGGKYMYVKKVKEKYTEHTRQVPHTTTINGHTHTYYTVETYWTWDRVDSEELRCKELSFREIVFNSNKFNIPEADYIETINESGHIRYQYYGTAPKFTGTIFTDLRNKTISDNTDFYNGLNIEETVNKLESKGKMALCIFWVLWILLICGLVFGFYYLDNRWLES